jgi:diguanylate cyclase
MDCESALQLISALIDGEIDPAGREQLKAHLEGCADCRQRSRDFRRQDQALRNALGAQRDLATAFTSRMCDWVLARDRPAWPRCTLLVVDDEPYILAMLSSLLGKEFRLLTAGSADAAQRRFSEQKIDLILTDQRMPRCTGVELLTWVLEHYPQTVRLLMTGYGELESAVDAINRGQVYHYLPKPWRDEELLQTLRNAAEKLLLERSRDQLLEELRQLNQELELRVAERTQKWKEACLLLEESNREMERLALTDPLTGLSNRRAIEERARAELQRLSRYPGPLTLGIIDVDHFKRINTEFQLCGGDEVLRELAGILARSIRSVDHVGRIGGEEFLVVAPQTNEQGALNLAERIRSTVAGTPIRYKDRDINVTVSLGIAVADTGVHPQYQQILEAADGALSAAKQNGRNRFELQRLGASRAG